MSKSENTIILLKDFNDSKPINENIVSMAVIGSYNTEFWIKNRSDIDVLILIKSKRDVNFEFELEDILIPKLQNFFVYEDIHLTFLYMNEFDTVFARAYIESCNKIIYDFQKEIDFRLYVNKFLRNNE